MLSDGKTISIVISNQNKNMNLIEIKSIGHLYNPSTGMLYPQFENGQPDMDNGIDRDEITGESLSLDDMDLIFDHKRKYEVTIMGQTFTRTTHNKYATAGVYVRDGKIVSRNPSYAGPGKTPNPNGSGWLVVEPVKVVKRWMPVLNIDGNQVR